MTDGWLNFEHVNHALRTVRTVEVMKLRGSHNVPGRHYFEITQEGIAVQPRLEAVLKQPATGYAAAATRVGTGIPGLDGMLFGGLPGQSMTLVLGPAGAGKTTMGLAFLKDCTPAEPGVFFGLYETPERLVRKAALVGIDVEAMIRSGALEIVWQPPSEVLPDELGWSIIRAAARRSVRKLVIDGVAALRQSFLYPGRLPGYLSALANELRSRGVTALATEETHSLFSTAELTLDAASASFDNIVALRYRERGGRLERLLSIIKARDSAFDSAVVPFTISEQGIAIEEGDSGADARDAG